MNQRLALLVVATALALAAASTAGAARSGQVCRPFKQGGITFNWEAIGAGWSCGSAKPWVVKLIGDRVQVTTKRVPLTNGPRGLHCYATASRGGHATSGACFKGTLAFPITGFAWFPQ